MEDITELLNKLVQDITNPDRNLNDIFLRVKVLAFKLNNQGLKDWAEKEINGYSNEDETPKYRTVPTPVFGDLIQDLPGRTIYRRNERLVISYISQESIDKVSSFNLRNSISEIEHFIKDGNELQVMVPYDIQLEISKTHSNFWHVQSASRVISSSYLVGVLNSVKSHLLDFVMELNSELGKGEISFVDRQKQVDELFKNNIGSIQGSNVTVNLGNNNQSLNTGEIKDSTVAQNQSNNFVPEEIEKIRTVLSKIKSDFEQFVQGDFREIIANQIQTIEGQLEKPSPVKIIIKTALATIHALLIEAAGSAYSPIILEQLHRLAG